MIYNDNDELWIRDQRFIIKIKPVMDILTEEAVLQNELSEYITVSYSFENGYEKIINVPESIGVYSEHLQRFLVTRMAAFVIRENKMLHIPHTTSSNNDLEADILTAETLDKLSLEFKGEIIVLNALILLMNNYGGETTDIGKRFYRRLGAFKKYLYGKK